MRPRHVIWSIAALAGLIAGALGSRFFVSAPDIYRVSEMELPSFLFAISALLAISWFFVTIFGRYSLFFFHTFLMLGIYATSYGLFELAFHAANHRPALSSACILLLGVVLVLSLYLASKLFKNRVTDRPD
jgi:hypothetical protein